MVANIFWEHYNQIKNVSEALNVKILLMRVATFLFIF